MQMENQFSSGDICAIIKACGEAGVIEFSLNSLKVLFNGHPSQMILAPVPAASELAGIEQDEFALKEEKLAHMDIENPAEYEKLLMSGDLVGESHEDNRGSESTL